MFCIKSNWYRIRISKTYLEKICIKERKQSLSKVIKTGQWQATLRDKQAKVCVQAWSINLKIKKSKRGS